MLNRVTLVGRITRDLELRKTTTGTSYVKFSVAMDRFGANQNQTDFVNCTAWARTAENMAQYLSKGAMIAVDGSLQSSTYQDQSGKTVYALEVNANRVSFLESKNSTASTNTTNTYENNASQEVNKEEKNEEKTIDVDDFFSLMDE